jgi:hypothetical protein
VIALAASGVRDCCGEQHRLVAALFPASAVLSLALAGIGSWRCAPRR